MTSEETIQFVRERTFFISVQTARGEARSATCFYIARLTPSNRIIVATARHVVEFTETTTIDWVFRRYSEDSQCLSEMKFTTNDQEESKRPYRFYKFADVAFIVLPPTDYPSTGEIVSAELESLPILPETHRITPGTCVGWLGFPGTVQQFLGYPQLCYFQGVVSAFHAEGSRGIYLVDGHNSRGVSGGPVFHWCEEDRSPEIIGIVSGYGCAEVDMPGLCVFEPINPIIAFLKAQYGKSSKEAQA